MLSLGKFLEMQAVADSVMAEFMFKTALSQDRVTALTYIEIHNKESIIPSGHGG